MGEPCGLDRAARMVKRTPIVLVFDVEPDERELSRDSRPDWLGFERLVDWIRPRRAALRRATGRRVVFNWALRFDEQIAVTYGRADWPAVRYRALLDELLQEGDGFGIHPHAWRWDTAENRWIADHARSGWPEHCTRLAWQTFCDAFGWPPDFFRHGDRFLSQELVQTLDALGVPVELTMEPGHPAVERMALHEHATGAIPDYRPTPPHPFQPSKEDFRVPGSNHYSVWSLPVATTGLLPPDKREPVLTAILGFPADRVISACQAVLAGGSPCLAVAARTDVLMNADWASQFEKAFEFLEQTVRSGAGWFCTPRQAIQWVQATTRGSRLFVDERVARAA